MAWKNTFAVTFPPDAPKTSTIEIHDWIFEELKLSEKEVIAVICKDAMKKVMIKVNDEKKCEETVMEGGGKRVFVHSDKTETEVKLDLVAGQAKYIRIHELPVEIEHVEVVKALERYGRVLNVTHEMWRGHKLKVMNGVRGVRIELQKHVPSYINVGEWRVWTQYKNQPQTCAICDGPHMRAACPQRRRRQDEQPERPLSYAMLLRKQRDVPTPPHKDNEFFKDNEKKREEEQHKEDREKEGKEDEAKKGKGGEESEETEEKEKTEQEKDKGEGKAEWTVQVPKKNKKFNFMFDASGLTDESEAPQTITFTEAAFDATMAQEIQLSNRYDAISPEKRGGADGQDLQDDEEGKRKIRAFCAALSRETRRDEETLLRFYSACLDELSAERSSNPAVVPRIASIKEKTLAIMKRRLAGAAARAKCVDVQDELTSVHHVAAAVRRKKANSISSLDGTAGQRLTEQEEISEYVHGHFQKLFQPPTDNGQQETPLLDEVEACITEADNEALLASITAEELLQAVRLCPRNKSPGEDGLTAELYLEAWDVIGEDLREVFNEMLGRRSVAPSHKQGVMVLIPKVTKPSKIGDLRPVTLLDVDGKIYSRVMTRRMEKLQKKMLHPMQVQSGSDRTMHGALADIRDLISVVDEANRQRGSKVGACMVSVDIAGAFNNPRADSRRRRGTRDQAAALQRARLAQSTILGEVIGPTITDEDNEALLRPVTKEELLEALKLSPRGRSPGEDGLTAEFYLATWSVLGEDFLDVANAMLDRRKVAPSHKVGVMTLIPKVASVERIGDLRPITLLNVDGKVFSRVVTRRLCALQPKLLHPMQ
ncbi:hypothetical protein FOCC_FOCC007789, partial [Frankliniella occidentalis]